MSWNDKKPFTSKEVNDNMTSTSPLVSALGNWSINNSSIMEIPSTKGKSSRTSEMRLHSITHLEQLNERMSWNDKKPFTSKEVDDNPWEIGILATHPSWKSPVPKGRARGRVRCDCTQLHIWNNLMKGYLKDEKETAKAFQKEWFLTDDVRVIHSDGYLEIKE
nr:AMP-dependent synthetase and ligase family protein [Tanacetum cinerariifolium]